MPRRALTDRFCAHAKAQEGEAQTDYFDEDVAGLALRASRAGTKTWTYHFTWGGRRVRMTFGTYPATSLSRARTQAHSARTDLEAGKDPRAALRKPDTLKAVCEEYLERECGMERDAEGQATFGAKVRTAASRLATFERLVYPELGGVPIDDVRRSNVVRLLDKIERERGASMADHALAYLSRVFSWHASRSDDFRSPIVRGMARTKPRELARERTLTDDEIRVVWNAAGRSGAFGSMVRFILLTAARRTEAAQARHSEIAGRDWTIPGARYKTKRDHLIPLSASAQAVLATRQGCDFVFSTDGATPISGFSKFKREFDNAVTAELREAPLPNWTLHDLRRTARSLMSRAGVPSDHAERCLGHVIPGVRGTYDRHGFYDEKARAFEALAAQIDRILNPHDNVVPMRADA